MGIQIRIRRYNAPLFSLELGRCPLNLVPITLSYPEQVVPSTVTTFPNPNSPNSDLSSRLSLNSHQVDKYWGCKMSIGFAKLNIGGASATSKVFKVSPLQKCWPKNAGRYTVCRWRCGGHIYWKQVALVKTFPESRWRAGLHCYR